MVTDHAAWVTQATELAHKKRYDEAREFALRVIREDGRNVSALWIVACVTDSLTERRNALKELLRIQPSNQSAHQMLNETAQQFEMSSGADTNIRMNRTKTSNVIRSIKPE